MKVRNRVIPAPHIWSKKLLLVVALVLVFGVGCAGSDQDELVAFKATLAGRPIDDSSPTDAIELHHERTRPLGLVLLGVPFGFCFRLMNG